MLLDREIEAREGVLVSAQTTERHAEQIVRTRLCRIARQRLPHLLDTLLEMPLLA